MILQQAHGQRLPEHKHALAPLFADFMLLRLLPQEAHYWTWSPHLAPNHFDPSPMSAYSADAPRRGARVPRQNGTPAVPGCAGR